MRTVWEDIHLQTNGEVHIIDITPQIESILNRSGMKNGMVCVFVPGSTGAVTTIEYEPGLIKDLPAALDRLFPRGINYMHEQTWHDGNGHSHVRAAFLGPSLVVPFKDGKLYLGTWQQIVFVELDVRNRRRTIHIQIIGE